MKKIVSIAAVLIALVAVSCNKERQCKCDYSDGATNTMQLLTVDRGMKCSSINSMAIEHKVTDSVTGKPIFVRTEMHTVNCRDYAENQQ